MSRVYKDWVSVCVWCVLSWAGSGQWPQVDGDKPPVGSCVCSRTCSMLWTGERGEGKAEGAELQGRGDFSRWRQGLLKPLHCSIPS